MEGEDKKNTDSNYQQVHIHLCHRFGSKDTESGIRNTSIGNDKNDRLTCYIRKRGYYLKYPLFLI